MSRFLRLLAFLLCPLVAVAKVSVERTSTGEVVLRGPSCRELLGEGARFSSWKWRLEIEENPSFLPALDQCHCSVESGLADCRLSLAHSAPQFFLDNLEKGFGKWGPNCWNTALRGAGVLRSPRYVSPNEIGLWVEASGLCRPVVVESALVPGDLLLIRSRTEGEIHGFTFISPNLVFSKENLSAAARIRAVTPEEVFEIFPVKKTCRALGSEQNIDCSSYLQAFHCDPASRDFLRSLPPNLVSSYLALDNLEISMGYLMTGWLRGGSQEVRSRALISYYHEMLLAMYAGLAGDFSSHSPSSARTHKTLLIERIESLLRQIEYLE